MKQKIAVIYSSKYGTTKKYANWIAEELSAEIFDVKSVKIGQLLNFSTIIYGGGLYAGGISGISFLTKNYNQISEKNIILYTCSLADVNNIENTNNIKENLKKVLSTEMQQNIQIFHLRGGIDYTNLGFVHKSLMALLHKSISKKDIATLSNENKQFLATYGKTVDFTDRNSIDPLLTYINRL